MVKSPRAPLSRDVAAQIAAARLERHLEPPSMLRQSSGVFLVTPAGDVWRVFDAEGVRAERCVAPSSDDEAMVRVFILPSNEMTRRIYRFLPNDDRSLT